MKFFTRYALFVSFILLPFFLGAQVPTGYYSTAEGKTGNELKAALYNIIKGHTEYPYTSSGTDVWDILKQSDKDPNNSTNVILIYSGRSVNAAQEYNNGSGWNREHVWAKSHGDFGTSPGPGTDAHHLRPADISVNSTRGNLDFDEGGSPVSGADGCYVDGDSFEPRDAVKGDVARMIFYMATRYEGNNGEPDLEVVDYVNTGSAPKMGKLSTLLKWNDQDPPDAFEKNRNDVIYNNFQHNRNPYIDHPEYVDEIWGTASGIADNPELSVSVYPNPASKVIHVENGLSTAVTYEIYNATGQSLRKGNFENGVNEIDISNYPKGLFLLMLRNTKEHWTKKYKILKL